MKTTCKSGFSLIEVMVSILLLLVLALGSFSIVMQTGSTIQRQQNKREAIIAANRVLDRYWSLPYDIADSTVEDLTDKIGKMETENVTVNGNAMLVETTFSAGTDASGVDYIEVVVDINHMGAKDDVVVTTRRYALGFSRAEL